jgi:NAD(P)-dependent dehydrogenase (short-subunit alcohol dehydrogenase family)
VKAAVLPQHAELGFVYEEPHMTVTTPRPDPPSARRAVLAGSTAIITGTGATSVATAQAFASAGASVALASRDELSMMRTVRGIEGRGGRAFAVPTDLSNAEAVERLVSITMDAFGRIDLAVNVPGPVDAPPGDPGHSCRAVYVAMQYELPAIIEAGGGAIVNAATTPAGRGSEDGQCVIGLSRATALDHEDRGVRVNALVSGVGTPADFASAAVWLCSDRAAHVTGTAVPLGLRPGGRAQPTQPGRTSPYS